MKKQTIKKRNLHKECWNLDGAFLKWLRVRLPIYLKDADRIVNLDYHTWEYKGETLTQKQLIKRMIKNLELEDALSEYDPRWHNAVDEILEIWSLIFHSMWW